MTDCKRVLGVEQRPARLEIRPWTSNGASG